MSYPEAISGAVGRYERWSVDRDTAALADMSTDPEVMRFLGGVASASATEELSRHFADHWATFGFGLWAVLDRDGTSLGYSGACHPGPAWQPEFAGEVEVGWRLARSAWGRGLATEGARLALDALSAHRPVERVIAFVDPDNERSVAVARRLGMRQATRALDPSGRAIDVLERPLEVPAA